MEKLEKLTQGEFGLIRPPYYGSAPVDNAYVVDKIKTITVQHPSDISSAIDEMAERDSVLIPKDANAYVASDFNPETQHIRKTENGEVFCSVYAIQFYNIYKK